MRHRWLKWALAGSMCGFMAAATAAGTDHRVWVDTWAAAPDSAGPVLNAQTVRQIVRTSVGGSELRIRLSNLFGSVPVTLGPAHVAVHANGADTVPGSDHPLLFNGKPTVTIAKGESVLSDPVKMDVKPLQELALSLYVPADTVYHAATIHNAGLATAYITESGDATAAVQFPRDEVSGNRFFLTDVEVSGPAAKSTVVTFGDSITDGVGAKPDANDRWPDDLAARLQADAKLSSIGVANSGIGGNRILHDNFGPSALARFDRDALDKPGVRWIVLLEGINDIGGSGYAWEGKDKITAQQLIEGMKTLIARAHAKHVKIYGATLTPYGGNGWPYHSAAGEKTREEVNAWIRSSGAFDGVADFDQAIRDPAAPKKMLAAYDSGDHLHPSSAGYKAMAAAIDLAWFKTP
ncbi:SGNH/GDSL hydrolase family protein [Dyella flagellata]|uniref:SGNH hydrolase n=1 Tax=Dyella flagellata TaxID=1867833 RepID=A0ABQ5X8S1_9GAMM|nr:SGNH/GDSL hydrolase family protein [Dyella flagellata]GLQ87302.1 SGNH hydrolase [Dyella flagellata]